MAWPSKNHIENLEEVLMRLHWYLLPDTVITELPYDLEFISKTDIERFADWCRKSVSREELAEGTYRINESLAMFFVKQAYPDLDKDQMKEKVDFLLEMLHGMLKVSRYEQISLCTATVDKLNDIIDETPGESHFDKTVKKIKVGVALKWLQDTSLLKELSIESRRFILRVGEFYGRVKCGEHVYADEIGSHVVSEEDKQQIISDYELKVELALMAASQELSNVKNKYSRDDIYGQFRVIVDTIKRMEEFAEGRYKGEYDTIEQFKDTIFVVIILNYVQDPYIKRSKEASNLLQLALPIYKKYREMESKS